MTPDPADRLLPGMLLCRALHALCVDGAHLRIGVWLLLVLSLAMAPARGQLPDKVDVLDRLTLVNHRWIQSHDDPLEWLPGARGWARSVYHLGNLAAHGVTGRSAWKAHTQQQSEQFQWLVNHGVVTGNADAQALGRVYLALSGDAAHLADTRAQAESLIEQGRTMTWTWVDAMFMQGNALIDLGRRYGNASHDFHRHHWSLFQHMRDGLQLLDRVNWSSSMPASGLWYRDERFRYPSHQSPNGRRVLWSRGNGWVFASLALTLKNLPATAPGHGAYLSTFRTMAQSLKDRQRADGFWNVNLDDPAHFGGPEASGTSAFVYGMALGVQLNLLDRATYLPVIARAWGGLVRTAVRTNGHLGHCQQGGDRPFAVDPNLTTDFCVGLFLLAASEVSRLAPAAPRNLATGATVRASAEQTGNEAVHAVDGDTAVTRWSAQGFPQSITLDLGAARTLSRTRIYPLLARAYRYHVEVSTDGARFTRVVNRLANTSGGFVLTDAFSPVSARYIRLTITGAANYAGDWVSINEFRVEHPLAP